MTAPPSDGETYDCEAKNPCHPENTAVNGYYYPHHEESKYIQCDAWGEWIGFRDVLFKSPMSNNVIETFYGHFLLRAYIDIVDSSKWHSAFERKRNFLLNLKLNKLERTFFLRRTHKRLKSYFIFVLDEIIRRCSVWDVSINLTHICIGKA